MQSAGGTVPKVPATVWAHHRSPQPVSASAQCQGVCPQPRSLVQILLRRWLSSPVGASAGTWVCAVCRIPSRVGDITVAISGGSAKTMVPFLSGPGGPAELVPGRPHLLLIRVPPPPWPVCLPPRVLTSFQFSACN